VIRLLFDKYGVTIFFEKDTSIYVSCKTRDEVEKVFDELTLPWFRTKDTSGEIVIQTSNILYARVTEYLTSAREDDDVLDDIEAIGYL
jgi:hypothetical protein